MNDHYVKILGTRGSVPVSGQEYVRYGGSTTCVLVRFAGQYIILDAGSGLYKLPAEVSRQLKIDILLTHLHLDHLTGLPLCSLLSQPGKTINIHLPEAQGFDAESSIRKLFSPPYWPVTLDELPAEIRFLPSVRDEYIESIHVETMSGVHPGGVALYRLSDKEKSIVFATDCTLTEPLLPELEAFSAHCDLLLIDGQYSDQEWDGRESYGHSKWTSAAEFGRECHAKQIRIIHHDPEHTDEILSAAEVALK